MSGFLFYLAFLACLVTAGVLAVGIAANTAGMIPKETEGTAEV